jgi:hypothetical protein
VCMQSWYMFHCIWTKWSLCSRPQEGAWPHGRKNQIQSSFNLWVMALSLRPCLDECMYFKLCVCDSMMKWPKGRCSNLHKRPCAWRAMWNAITSSCLQIEIYKVQKPPLIQLTFNWLLQVLGIQFWGVGNIPHNAHTCIEKNEDLQTFIYTTWCMYVKRLK